MAIYCVAVTSVTVSNFSCSTKPPKVGFENLILHIEFSVLVDDVGPQEFVQNLSMSNICLKYV